MADLWAEIWTLPELGSFTMRRAGVPGVGKIRRPFSGIGRSDLTVPTDWEHLDDLLAASAGSLVRVCQRDSDGNREIVAEWYPEGTGEPFQEHATTKISGPSIEARLDSTVLLPYDWPANPTVARDWYYGGDNRILSNPDFEDGTSNVFTNPDFEDGTVDPWTALTGTDTNPLDADLASTNTKAQAGTYSLEVDPGKRHSGALVTLQGVPGEELTIDGYVNGTAGRRITAAVRKESGMTFASTNGYLYNGWHIVELGNTAPNSPPDGLPGGSLTGGATWDALGTIKVTPGTDTDDPSTIRYVVQDDHHNDTNGPKFWIDSFTATGIGTGLDPWGMYLLTAAELDTVAPLAGSQSAKVTGPDGSSLWQDIDGMTIGQVYTFRATVYHEAGADRDIIAQYGIPGNSAATIQNSYTVPDSTETVIWVTWTATQETARVEVKNDAGVVLTWWIDSCAVAAGLPPSNAGEIWGVLLADAQTDHAAESGDYAMASLTWLKKDFTDSVDSASVAWVEDLNMRLRRFRTYGQIMDQFVRLGYEYRIVPNPSFGSPDTESHLLQVFNPWDSSTYTGGVGTDRTSSVKITTGQNVLTGPISRQALSRTVAIVEDEIGNLAISKDATGVTNWGQRQMGTTERNVFEDTTLRSVADVALSDRALTSASQITMHTGQFLPLSDFEPGDTIMFSAPPKIPASAHRVAMVTTEYGDQPTVWTIDFDKPVYTGLAGTVHAVNQLLRRSAEPPEVREDDDPDVETVEFDGPIEVTYLVAADDARTELQGVADFVCSGTNDEQEINAAIAALAGNGGKIQLTEGTFTVETPIVGAAGVWLCGAGEGVTTLFLPTGFTLSGAPEAIDLDYTECRLSDVTIEEESGD